MRPLKENEDFCFSEIIIEEEPIHAVKLLTGPFKNTIVYYGHVKLVPENSLHRLAFQYTIWDSAGFTKEELVGSSAFTTTLGEILSSIIADENHMGEYATPARRDDS